MTHVVCEPCCDCKYTDCVVVCPAECFWQDDRMLYIDPAECIDCEACKPECPVEAIRIGPRIISFPVKTGMGEEIRCWPRAGDVPPQWEHFIQLNAERAGALKASGNGPITQKGVPLIDPECVKK